MSKILQISDTHIVPQNSLAYGRVDTTSALKATIETVNGILDAIGPVDAVVLTGDLTDFGTLEEYEIFKSILAPLTLPYLAIPGNHDGREAMRDAFADQTWMPASGPIFWHLDLEDFVLVGLDSLVEGCAHGVLGEANLSYLGKVMRQANGKPLLISFHHPPVAIGLDVMDGNNLRDSDPLADCLREYDGDIRLITGHVHRSSTSLFANRVCLTCPGPSHAVSMDLRPNAINCLTKEPGGFMLHEWRDGFVSHVIPVGLFDGPHPFYP